MTKWEYLYARVEDEIVKYINNQPAGGKLLGTFGLGGEGVVEFLSKVGQEGWELVGITQGAGVSWRLILKRPLSDKERNETASP